MNKMKASKLARKESLTGFLFCLPSIIGMLVFFVIPFCLCLYMSFTESSGSVRFVGLKNYAEVLKSAAFRLAAGNTLKFIVIAVPGNHFGFAVYRTAPVQKAEGLSLFPNSVCVSSCASYRVGRSVFPNHIRGNGTAQPRTGIFRHSSD